MDGLPRNPARIAGLPSVLLVVLLPISCRTQVAINEEWRWKLTLMKLSLPPVRSRKALSADPSRCVIIDERTMPSCACQEEVQSNDWDQRCHSLSFCQRKRSF
jgi:hypothetical protein